MKENFNEELLPTSNNQSKSKTNSKYKGSRSSDFDDIIDEENLIELSPRGRNIVFVLYLISNILISMDHGSIPASINELRQLTTYDQSIGLFGSLVYLGNIIGSMIFFQLINIYNRKLLLLISLLGNTICLFTFVLIENIPFLFINRILVGMLQSYITIYMPVWCNQFGLQTQRNYMIGLIQLVSPIGIFLGYFIASVCINDQIYGGWKFAFFVQGFLILFLNIFFLFVPKNFFSKYYYSVGETKEEEKIVKKTDEEVLNMSHNEDLNYLEKIKVLMDYKVFIYSVISMSILIYIITGVQYWVTDYLDQILGIKSQKDRLFLFTVACFTAPVMGVLIGTEIKNKFCQQNMQKSLIFCSILGILASICSIPVPITLSLSYFIVFMWLVLFFGAGIVPVLTSIIINSVPEEHIASANSMTNLITNALGYLPSPYVYGILSDIKGDLGVLGMKVTMWIAIPGMVFLCLATYISFKDDTYKNKIV
jgi:MFS family permease